MKNMIARQRGCMCVVDEGGVVEARIVELGTEYHVVGSTRCGIVCSLRSTWVSECTCG